MHLIYPDEGLLTWLKKGTSENLKYRLFSNNITPDRDTILSGVTQASFTGYPSGGITVAPGDFTLEATVGHVGNLLAAPIAFLSAHGAPYDCYGYYVVDAGATKLLAIARFDDAPVSKDDGESWIVVPTVSDLSQFAD